MAKIIPFKAVRPTRSKACLIASRPYYTYKKSLLKAKLLGNPFTFLHVINPEFSKGDKTTPNSKERFEKVSKKYNEFKASGFFIKEKFPCLYIYRQTTKQGIYSGIIAGASVEDYVENKIKKHENTLKNRESVFKNYLDICQFHAEPVLLAYDEPENVNQLITKTTSKRPEYEFFTTDEKGHELWVIKNQKDIQLIVDEFKKVSKSYIADGHHRASSSLLYSSDNQKKNNILKDYFLAFFIDSANLKIFEFNRFIKSISPLSKEEFLIALEESFIVSQTTRKHQKPTSKKELTIYIDKKWYLLKIKNELYDKLEFKEQLNSELVSNFILKPILNIMDLRTNEKVDFISGFSSIKELTKRVNETPMSVGVCLFPHDFDEVKEIADKGLTMPPKSTWIEPKLRSALTIYEY